MWKGDRKGPVTVGRSHLFILGQRLVLALHNEVLDEPINTCVNVMRLNAPEDGRPYGSGLREEKEIY